MVIQHNMQAMNSSRMLGITTSSQGKVTEKLSSGYKINRAADDAAGLSISEKMRKQIRGLDRASTNAQDGVSCVQTAEGALNEVHSMLQRMNELAVQSANGTNSQTDRDALQAEIDQLSEEIDRVSETTKFNETYLLKGDATAGTKDVYTYKSVTVPAEFTPADGKTFADFYAEGATAAYADEDALKADLAAGKKIYTTAQTVTTAQDPADKLTANTEYTINDATGTTSSTAGLTGITISDNTLADGTVFTYSTANGRWEDADGNDASTKVSATGTPNDGDTITVTAATVTKNGVADIYAENGDTALTDEEIIAADANGDNLYKTAAVLSQTKATSADYTYTPESKGMAKLYDDAGNEVKAKDISQMLEDGKTLYSDAAHTKAVAEADMDKYTNKETVNKALSLNLHVGADSDKTNKIGLSLESMSAAGIGVKGLKIDTEDNATYAIDTVADALQRVSEQRSALGAIQNRLEHTIANLDNVVENTTSAESRIRDVDMADAMVEYSKNNILQQAGQSMLAQANQANQGVLSLLQ